MAFIPNVYPKIHFIILNSINELDVRYTQGRLAQKDFRSEKGNNNDP